MKHLPHEFSHTTPLAQTYKWYTVRSANAQIQDKPMGIWNYSPCVQPIPASSSTYRVYKVRSTSTQRKRTLVYMKSSPMSSDTHTHTHTHTVLSSSILMANPSILMIHNKINNYTTEENRLEYEILLHEFSHTHYLVQTSRWYTMRATSTQLKTTIFLKM